jgi:hypothetical protein
LEALDFCDAPAKIGKRVVELPVCPICFFQSALNVCEVIAHFYFLVVKDSWSFPMLSFSCRIVSLA